MINALVLSRTLKGDGGALVACRRHFYARRCTTQASSELSRGAKTRRRRRRHFFPFFQPADDETPSIDAPSPPFNLRAAVGGSNGGYTASARFRLEKVANGPPPPPPLSVFKYFRNFSIAAMMSTSEYRVRDIAHSVICRRCCGLSIETNTRESLHARVVHNCISWSRSSSSKMAKCVSLNPCKSTTSSCSKIIISFMVFC